MSILSSFLNKTLGIPEVNLTHITPAQIVQAAPLVTDLQATYEPILDNWLRTEALVLPASVVSEIEAKVTALLPGVSSDQVAAVIDGIQAQIQNYAVSQVHTFLTHELSTSTPSTLPPA